MKKFVRHPLVQSVLARLVSSYLAFTLATMRWRFENWSDVAPLVTAPGGGIACFWHGRIALAVACRAKIKSKPRRVLISRSPDGEFISKVVGRLDFPAIRASTRRRDPTRAHEGFTASRDVLRFIADGGLIVITPDGPIGPAERMQLGPVVLARLSETPVVFMGLAARPALRLKSWDATRIPLPFGRGCVVFEGPIRLRRDCDAAGLEATRVDWEARLQAAQSRAEALIA